MRLHERTMLVQGARCEFTRMTLDWIEKHGLTYGEVASVLGEEICILAKMMIRHERHPDDPDKRGDEA
jgi:hypothetical protein